MGDLAMIEVFVKAGFIGNGILLLLLIMSIFLWAIIYQKYRSHKILREDSDEFFKRFVRTEKFVKLPELLQKPTRSPLKLVVEEVLNEAKKFSNYVSYDSLDQRSSLIEDAIQRAVESQRMREEKHLTYLSVCTSLAPFMGLLGTVWGITLSFYEIGKHGNAELSVVAPGIAAALITTIGGLVVAIPASAAYNFFVTKNNHNEVFYYNFGSMILSLFKRGDLNALEEPRS